MGGCYKSYCYISRYNPDKVYINENIDQILDSINNWVDKQVWEKIPNQCDSKYYVIDIATTTDIPLMSKYYDWQKVFDFFNNHEKAKSTFATKYPTRIKPYNIDPVKNRIRVSLMPQIYSDILEPKTDKIVNRINMIPILQKQFEVHINFSPIIFYQGWLQEYDNLFKLLSGINFKSECIFLTYNELQYKRNSDEVNTLCWNPSIQELKNSNYADNNIRYQHELKSEMINKFKKVYSKYFDLETIRYIF